MLWVTRRWHTDACVDGDEGVSFLVFRAKGASEVSVAEITNEVVDDLRAANPNVAITLIGIAADALWT